MRIVSGAGEFDVTISKVVLEDRSVVMIGKMGVWEARLVLTAGEALGLAKSMALPLLRALLGLESHRNSGGTPMILPLFLLFIRGNTHTWSG